jgi:hypothetical protein
MSRSLGTKIVGAVLALGTTSLAIFFLLLMLKEGRFVGPLCLGCSTAWTLVLPSLSLAGGVAIFFALLRGPVGKAIGRMLETRDARDKLDDERFRQLDERLAEGELDRQHVAELEERLDFAERLLAGRDDRASLLRERTPV